MLLIPAQAFRASGQTEMPKKLWLSCSGRKPLEIQALAESKRNSSSRAVLRFVLSSRNLTITGA
jgi:hypothetical protein